MAAKDGSIAVGCGDRSSIFIASPFRESYEQKAEKPKKYEGSWFSSLSQRS